MARYLRLNEHLSKTVEVGLFPEDFDDQKMGEIFIKYMREKGKPAKVLTAMIKGYCTKRAKKRSIVQRTNLMLSAGIGDFGKVDTFLLNGILNGIGRRGGKASNEAIVQKILCHDKIRHIGTDWINKKRREAEVTRRRVLKSYACRFRARIGQSPLHRYQTSIYGSFRNTILKVPLEIIIRFTVTF